MLEVREVAGSGIDVLVEVGPARVRARGFAREVLGDGGRAQHPCHTPVIGQ